MQTKINVFKMDNNNCDILVGYLVVYDDIIAYS